MQRAFANEAEQRAFRKELEAMLRNGEADTALASVREQMSALADAGLSIIEIALGADPDTVSLKGWDKIAATIAREEKSGKVITAIGIDFSWPGHVDLMPDADGHLAPYIETNYYTDQSDMKFSEATRDQILAGYSNYGSEWQGCFAEIDNAIEVNGMSALYGAVTAASSVRNHDDSAGDAYVLAACTSAIILHLAVRKAIQTGSLPKPMVVLVGSNEDFPFFDAPVMSVDESRPFVRLFEQAAGDEHRSAHRDAGYRSTQSSQQRAKRNRPSVDDILKEHPEFTDFARRAEQSLRHVRKPKDVLPALGNLAASALADFLSKRR